MIDSFDSIAWQNAIELWHILVLFGVLIIAAYWEHHKKKPRKSARIIALSLVLICLYMIYLSPYILREKDLKSVVLISKDVAMDFPDSLNRADNLPLLKEQGNGKFIEEGKEDLTTLDELNYKIDTAFIYGYFDHLNPKYYQVRQDFEIRKGIQLDFQKRVALGDSLLIDLQNLENKEIEVVALVGQDTIIANISKRGFKTIGTLPKVTGNVFCEVQIENRQYHFSVRVEKSKNYVMQILAATPDFEWKFLGDYLKNQEHSVYQKTQISKGKFKSSFYNWHDSLQINRGVAKDLKVVFTDAQAWKALDTRNRNQFLDQLKKNRGSLIFRTNANSKIQLNLDKSKLTNIFSTTDNLLESKYYNYLQFNNIYELDEVVRNSLFRQVQQDVIFGVINFQNSFQLKLSGNTKEYERIWSPIFSHLIRNSSKAFYDKSKWAVQHQPFFFRLWSNEKDEEISIFNFQNDTVKLKSKPDYIFPERQHFMFYPKKLGWHFLKVPNQSEIIPFYVHSEALLDQSEFLINYIHDYLNYLNFAVSNNLEEEKKYNQNSVTLWFFLLFLICVGYLWIEDKIT